jgi:hydrogenase maturation protein HypF
MALAHAADAELLAEVEPFLRPVDDRSWDVVLAQVRTGLASPFTSSAGRLFDAVSALLDVRRDATFDGQPAMELEQVARRGEAAAPVGIWERDGVLEVDTRDLIAEVVDGLRRGVDLGTIAGRFHASFASATAAAAVRLAHQHTLDRVVLGGGVFSNDVFTSDLVSRLTDEGLRVFLPMEVPIGDGGIALGQAVVAAAREVV